MTITKLGHCTLIIDIRGVRFLTDPGAYTIEQNVVGSINYIVLSHEHTDHLHIESVKKLLALNPSAHVIANASVGAILTKESIPFIKLTDGEGFDAKGVNISAHGTTHAPIYRDYEQVENTGYFFDNKLFYPGDAFHVPNKPVDVLAFPITAPWCTVAQAVDYAIEVKPRIAFGVHDGNLIRQTGITKRLPELFFPQHNIQFLYLELGKPTEIH